MATVKLDERPPNRADRTHVISKALFPKELFMAILISARVHVFMAQMMSPQTQFSAEKLASIHGKLGTQLLQAF